MLLMSKLGKCKAAIITSYDETFGISDGKIRYYGSIDADLLHRQCLSDYCYNIYNYNVCNPLSDSEPIIYLLKNGNIVFLHASDFVCRQGLFYIPEFISAKQRKKFERVLSKMEGYFTEACHVSFNKDDIITNYISCSYFDNFKGIRDILDEITVCDKVKKR